VPEQGLRVLVPLAHQSEERGAGPRGGEEEPGLLGGGPQAGPFQAPPDPLDALGVDPRSGPAAGDLAVCALGAQERDQVVRELFAADLPGGPAHGRGHCDSPAEAQEITDTTAIEHLADGDPADLPHCGVVVRGAVEAQVGEPRVTVEEVGVAVDG